jgi:hypothetical protein
MSDSPRLECLEQTTITANQERPKITKDFSQVSKGIVTLIVEYHPSPECPRVISKNGEYSVEYTKYISGKTDGIDPSDTNSGNDLSKEIQSLISLQLKINKTSGCILDNNAYFTWRLKEQPATKKPILPPLLPRQVH